MKRCLTDQIPSNHGPSAGGAAAERILARDPGQTTMGTIPALPRLALENQSSPAVSGPVPPRQVSKSPFKAHALIWWASGDGERLSARAREKVNGARCTQESPSASGTPAVPVACTAGPGSVAPPYSLSSPETAAQKRRCRSHPCRAAGRRGFGGRPSSLQSRCIRL
jgi:hypothetical protein